VSREGIERWRCARPGVPGRSRALALGPFREGRAARRLRDDRRRGERREHRGRVPHRHTGRPATAHHHHHADDEHDVDDQRVAVRRNGASGARRVTAAHNAVRATASPVPSPPLAPLCWNASVASVAQSWANACSWRHNPNLSNLGENIAAFSGNRSASAARDAVDLWADEASDYHYSSNSCSGVCGHYTQIVWRSTTEVGCGLRVCTTGSPFDARFGATWTMVVCDYRPPGNFGGQRPY
jgi:pathogenesis-related protein 1